MARLVAGPLRQSSASQSWFFSRSTTTVAAHLSSLFVTTTPQISLPSVSDPLHRRFFAVSTLAAGARTRGVRPSPPELAEDAPRDEADTDSKRSRNELKRDARRAVRWGMDLATFSAPQIKRILRIASLEQEVFEAVMLVKKFGSDVREGKRRQFNYIGRLLRAAEPELMDALIQASKDGDNDKLVALSGQETWSAEDDDDTGEETSYEEESDEFDDYIEIANRWSDGLIYKDSSITNEVYSIHSVEFDRQELRKLVRRVQSIQGSPNKSGAEDDSPVLTRAKKPLIRFLCSLAKQSSTE